MPYGDLAQRLTEAEQAQNPLDASQAVEKTVPMDRLRRIFFVWANHLWYHRNVSGHGVFLLAERFVWELPLSSFVVCEAGQQSHLFWRFSCK